MKKLRTLEKTPPSTLMKTVAMNIKLKRVKLGLSQHELSRKAGLSDNFIGLVERCKINPTLSALEKISDALMCPLNNLMQEQD